MLAEQFAPKPRQTGFSAGDRYPDDADRTPRSQSDTPDRVLRHFLGNRVQMYLDFIVNLVDVRDVAAGLILAMERGANRTSLTFSAARVFRLKKILQLMARSAAAARLHPGSRPGGGKRPPPCLSSVSDHVTRRPPSGTAEGVRIAVASEGTVGSKRRSMSLAMRPAPSNPRCATR